MAWNASKIGDNEPGQQLGIETDGFDYSTNFCSLSLFI